jgi:hypothetical protein
MAEAVSGDPRFFGHRITSSGQFSANSALYDAMHTPFKVMNGGPDDMAYENGLRDYEEISARGSRRCTSPRPAPGTAGICSRPGATSTW